MECVHGEYNKGGIHNHYINIPVFFTLLNRVIPIKQNQLENQMTKTVNVLSFNPTSGSPGTTVEVSTESFKPANPKSFIFLGGKIGKYPVLQGSCTNEYDFSSFSFDVPESTPPGSYDFDLTFSDGAEAYRIATLEKFTVDSSAGAPPAIANVNPARVPVGQFRSTNFKLTGLNLDKISTFSLRRVSGDVPLNIALLEVVSGETACTVRIRAVDESKVEGGDVYQVIGITKDGVKITSRGRITLRAN
jgi:hypothetical protein